MPQVLLSFVDVNESQRIYTSSRTTSNWKCYELIMDCLVLSQLYYGLLNTTKKAVNKFEANLVSS